MHVRRTRQSDGIDPLAFENLRVGMVDLVQIETLHQVGPAPGEGTQPRAEVDELVDAARDGPFYSFLDEPCERWDTNSRPTCHRRSGPAILRNSTASGSV